MKENPKSPPLRKEHKISHLTLYFPGPGKLGNIGIYKLDANGLRLVRSLIGVRLEKSFDPECPPC